MYTFPVMVLSVPASFFLTSFYSFNQNLYVWNVWVAIYDDDDDDVTNTL